MTDIEALDRAVAEANAKVAEAAERYDGAPTGPGWDALRSALRSRTAALAARAEAEKPKLDLLTAMEATRIFQLAAGFGVGVTGLQAVLSAAHERAFRVIEALPTVWETGDGRKLAPLSDIRTALGVKP
jgi:hypothetical protein